MKEHSDSFDNILRQKKIQNEISNKELYQVSAQISLRCGITYWILDAGDILYLLDLFILVLNIFSILDKRRYRESYIYSDTHDLVANGTSFRGNLSPSSKSAMTRFSVVSDSSSNTTSGIASDKMTVSFEENDGIHCIPLYCNQLSTDLVIH